MPVFVHCVAIVFDSPHGPPQTKYFWWASAQRYPEPKEVTQNLLHGPYDSEAEAAKAARIAVEGPGVTEGGMWDPAWEKPQ